MVTWVRSSISDFFRILLSCRPCHRFGSRSSGAALLNAAHPDIGCDLNEDRVKAELQEALTSGDYRATHNFFKDLNKQGCPIDGM